MLKGKLIVVDGIDGCGKSSLIHGLVEHLKSQGKKVFSTGEYCKTHDSLPESADLMQYDVVVVAEPTRVWVGKAIRDEITKSQMRKYSAIETATAFSLDRAVLYRRVIIPLLEKGKIVISDRSVTTSLIYQPIQAEKIKLSQVLGLYGNRLALKYRPDLLVIATVDPRTAIERLRKRLEKDDNSIFDHVAFLEKAQERFTSSWFREFFEKKGAKVAYVDMNRTIDEEVADVVSHYESLFRGRLLQYMQ